MTLIECFTAAHIDNIAACLRLHPEKLIFVGDAAAMKKPVARYKELFTGRYLKTVVDTCSVDEKDCEELQAAITRLIREAEECVIDMTGGEPVVALAIGLALANLEEEKRKRVRVEWYDHETGMIVDCINDNRRRPAKRVHLTVKELIKLHGGDIYASKFKLPADASLQEMSRLWRVMAEMPKQWNDAIGLLRRFEKYSESEDYVCVDLLALWEIVPDLKEKEEEVRELVEKLEREGILTDQSSHNYLEYEYNSPFLRQCIYTQGNTLEIKTLLEGKAAKVNGVPLFRDGQMGVRIDWDGKIYPYSQTSSGTNNEIDVVLMHGMVPLFISCKNGDVKTEELYKLHTVATRFGGPYARKMLLVSDMDRKDAVSAQALVGRAWDMDIFLVPDVAELSEDQWQEMFRIPFSPDPKKDMEKFLKTIKKGANV